MPPVTALDLLSMRFEEIPYLTRTRAKATGRTDDKHQKLAVGELLSNTKADTDTTDTDTGKTHFISKVLYHHVMFFLSI